MYGKKPRTPREAMDQIVEASTYAMPSARNTSLAMRKSQAALATWDADRRDAEIMKRLTNRSRYGGLTPAQQERMSW